MMFARHHIAKLFGAAIAVAALGLVTPGSAAADATDDAFLKKLFADAINFSQSGNRLFRGPGRSARRLPPASRRRTFTS